MGKGTRRISVRLTDAYWHMLAQMQTERWSTKDLSATLRTALEVAYSTGWRRCCVCKKGLGPALGITGAMDCYCPEHYKEAMREAERDHGDE